MKILKNQTWRLPRYLLMSCLTLPLWAFGESSAQTTGDLPSRLERLEQTAEDLYRFQRLDEEKSGASEGVQAFNRWLETGQARLQEVQKDLQRESLELEEQMRAITLLDVTLKEFRPNRRDEQAIQRHNEKVAERNEQVRRYSQRVERFNARQEAYNKSAEEFRQEADKRRVVAQTLQTAVIQKAEAYKAWHDSDQDRAYWDQVNHFWLDLQKWLKKADPLSPEIHRLQERYTNLRRLLGNYAGRKQSQVEFGLVIVRAQFGNGIEGHFMVDTGASYVTLTEALAQAIGAQPQGGDPLELDIAGGHRIVGPLVKIPRMEVAGQSLRDVPAVVIPSGSLGVDGLLGHSFLGRFRIILDKSADPPLRLENPTSNNE